MKNRKNIIREGDTVKIHTPHIFVRVGYSLTIDLVRKSFTEEQEKAVLDMLLSFGIRDYDIDIVHGGKCLVWRKSEDKEYDKLLNDIARFVMGKKGWGGSERKIYEEYKPDLYESVCRVIGKKIVKTGKHCSGYSCYDYYNGGYDYDPPYLANEETHIILELCQINNSENLMLDSFWINSKHVDKMNEESNWAKQSLLT